MKQAAGIVLGADRVEALLRDRSEANAQFFAAEAERLARLCHRMAERFAREGRLVAFGATPADRSDARHVAVEFVHPVIVGKRALPALGIAGEGGRVAAQVAREAEGEDIAMGFGENPDTFAALAAARRRGCLTVAFAPGSGAEWEFDLSAVADPFIRQEIVETLYHLLWELVHIFLDHRGLLEGRAAKPVHDPGASSFLYPFLTQQETNLDDVLDDVRKSMLLKADEVVALRAQSLTDGCETLLTAARILRERLDAGGRLIALGNGGSATDAMDVVADFHTPLFGGPARRALDLTEDTGIITAVANDIGTEEIFQRQVIAYGREGDVLLALSTSGNSLSILEALKEARRRKLVTMALVGYDGGNVAAQALAHDARGAQQRGAAVGERLRAQRRHLVGLEQHRLAHVVEDVVEV
ncbi:MAG TPA: SIS domain-containing protein, partial [Solirubrobacteraceae bacterium]|nr:SIS domain-containing protein [Solirubrobacteraceae bacterium]